MLKTQPSAGTIPVPKNLCTHKTRGPRIVYTNTCWAVSAHADPSPRGMASPPAPCVLPECSLHAAPPARAAARASLAARCACAFMHRPTARTPLLTNARAIFSDARGARAWHRGAGWRGPKILDRRRDRGNHAQANARVRCRPRAVYVAVFWRIVPECGENFQAGGRSTLAQNVCAADVTAARHTLALRVVTDRMS